MHQSNIEVLEDNEHIIKSMRDVEEGEEWPHVFKHVEWGICIWGTDGKTLEKTNPAFARMHGYRVEELTGRPITDIFAPECCSELSEHISAAHRDGHHVFESKLIRKDGTTFPAFVDITTAREGGEKMQHQIVNIRDITERKKAEKELRQYHEAIGKEAQKRAKEIVDLKEFNENIIQSTKESLVIEDARGFITFANPLTLGMLGYTKEEMLGRHWSNFVAPGYYQKVEEETRKGSKGIKSRYEDVLISKSGEEIHVITSAAPVFENNEFKGVLSVITDISVIKKTEKEKAWKTLRYNVRGGNTYLVKEKKLKRGLDVFIDLTNSGLRGLIITRTYPEKIREMCKTEVPIMWLSTEKKGEMTMSPEFPLIRKTIEDFAARDSVVMLDGLGYLIAQNGFGDALDFIQMLSDMYHIRKSVLIISIDPDTLTNQELCLLERETKELKLKDEPDLSEDLREVLEFVYRENKDGRKPSYSEVGKSFDIVRSTTRRRIKRLKNKGLLVDKAKGRYKVLELTERGGTFF